MKRLLRLLPLSSLPLIVAACRFDDAVPSSEDVDAESTLDAAPDAAPDSAPEVAENDAGEPVPAVPGTIDPTFPSAPFDVGFTVEAVDVDANGRIYLVGIARNGTSGRQDQNPLDGALKVMRLSANGAVDPSYGTRTVARCGAAVMWGAAAITKSGDVVVVTSGGCTARVDPSGVEDPWYGGEAFVAALETPRASALVLPGAAPAGSLAGILVAGGAQGDGPERPRFSRLSSSGAAEASFAAQANAGSASRDGRFLDAVPVPPLGGSLVLRRSPTTGENELVYAGKDGALGVAVSLPDGSQEGTLLVDRGAAGSDVTRAAVMYLIEDPDRAGRYTMDLDGYRLRAGTSSALELFPDDTLVPSAAQKSRFSFDGLEVARASFAAFVEPRPRLLSGGRFLAFGLDRSAPLAAPTARLGVYGPDGKPAAAFGDGGFVDLGPGWSAGMALQGTDAAIAVVHADATKYAVRRVWL